jgi:predicted dehydrogenase
MRKLRVGVIGLRFGQHVIETEIVHGPGQRFVELASVCDLNRDRREVVASKYGVPGYASIDAMLASIDLDVVALFTPPHGRAELISEIIRSGKHVITTKPFEVDPAAAAAVLAEAERLGRVVHLNSPGPQQPPEIAQILTWRQQYELGAAVSAHAETWASYHEVDDGSWFCDPMKCPAAPLLRIGVYCINDLVRLFGPAEQVSVMHRRLRSGRPTSDNAQLLIGFPGGVLASVYASFCIDDGNRYASGMRVSYERGTIYSNAGPTAGQAEHIELQLVMRCQGKRSHVVERATVSLGSRSNTYQWAAFHQAVEDESRGQHANAQAIVQGVAVLAAMAKAAVSGATEPVAVIVSPAPPRHQPMVVN